MYKGAQGIIFLSVAFDGSSEFTPFPHLSGGDVSVVGAVKGTGMQSQHSVGSRSWSHHPLPPLFHKMSSSSSTVAFIFALFFPQKEQTRALGTGSCYKHCSGEKAPQRACSKHPAPNVPCSSTCRLANPRAIQSKILSKGSARQA